MPHTWKQALDRYRYPADLRRFAGRHEHPGWFESNLGVGDRRETMDFEARFRHRASDDLRAWGEVVFWKLYTIPLARNKTTRAVLDSGVSARELRLLCMQYVEEPNSLSRAAFSAFRKKLFGTPRVATAAAFAAFLRPDEFPMVDTQITRWAKENGPSHGYSVGRGPDLACIPDLHGEQVMESHWPFVESWIKWCRFTARILSRLTECAWRARDVEMAVFTAQRVKEKGDHMPLTPLSSPSGTCVEE